MLRLNSKSKLPNVVKKTQKTPKKEMELAIKYKHDYESREGEGNE